MLKIWCRITSKEKIIKQNIVQFDEREVTFYQIVKTICESLDIPTPVILMKHLYDLKKFGISHFGKGDFVEKIDFDKLLLEVVKE